MTNRIRLILGLTLAAVLSLAAFPAVVSAEEYTCRGTLGAVTLDNLRVPQNSSCTLNGTFVKGTIKVERNATLKASCVRVIGNVQAENAHDGVVQKSSRIGGSVQIKQGGSASILSSQINADIQFDANSRYLKANDNRVGGNIQVMSNSGGVEIFRNSVDSNLQCKENRPAPTGGNNVVQGNKEDQCRRL